MSLDPDLIIVINESDYEIVKDIAPTVFIPFTEMGYSERLTYIGEVLNKQDEATILLADYEEKTQATIEKIHEEKPEVYNMTFSIVELWEAGSNMIVGDRWGRGGDIIYNKLGLTPSEKVQEEIFDGGEPYLLISDEVLPEYTGDYLVVSTSDDGITGYEDMAIWNSLSAVQNDNLIYVPFGMFYYDDIISQEAQLDVIIDEILN